MRQGIDGTAMASFLTALLLTGASGIAISQLQKRNQKGLQGWGLGGRQFGTLITWFLVGGDFYTAYTIIAVPAVVFSTGAAGFFALPYTILVYPFVFVTMPRLWSVCRRHGLVTPADFVKLRYGSRGLATAVTITGIVSLIPYIALQFAGIGIVLSRLAGNAGSSLEKMGLVVAFGGVAIFTCGAGLRAPALIAVAKDVMIYIVVIAAITALPHHFGGYRHIFTVADDFFRAHSGAVVLPPSGFNAYATLALGSALAGFMYPHTMTSVLAASSPRAIRKNAVLLPAYTVLLGLVALLGIVGVAAGLRPDSSKDVIPTLFAIAFPSWFKGFAFAAIVIAAVVPAAIMSIAAANLFTKNVYVEYFDRNASSDAQVTIAKVASVVVNAGALAFVLAFPAQYAINLQLLGGVLILQTFPAITFGLWKRIFHHAALLSGWIVSLVVAWILLAHGNFRSPTYPLAAFGQIHDVYIGLISLTVNLAVTAVLTLTLDAGGVRRGPDGSIDRDYVG